MTKAVTPSIDPIKMKELRAKIDKQYDDLEDLDRALNALTGLDKLRELSPESLIIGVSATGEVEMTSAAAIYMRKAVANHVPQIVADAIRLAQDDLRKAGAAV